MSKCPFCETDVGEAIVCKGCGSYRSNQPAPEVMFRVKLLSVFVAMVAGLVIGSFWAVIIALILTFLFGSLFARSLGATEKVWIRRF